MPRVSKAPEVRRQELLDAAAQLFLRKGYERTSVRDILAVVEGQPGMFYYYFSSKAELFCAAMNGYVEKYVAEVTAILEDKGAPPAQRLRAALGLAAHMLAHFNVATDRGAVVENVGLLTANCLRFLDRLVEPAAALICELTARTTLTEARVKARFFLYGMFGLMHDPGCDGGEDDLFAVVEEGYALAARLLGISTEQLKGEQHGEAYHLLLERDGKQSG